MSLNLYLIALGSNLGDRQANIEAATGQIATQVGVIRACASLYETAPVGAANQLFLNTVLVCASTYPPEDALAALLTIEQNLGRVREETWGNRTIDLDIVLWLNEDPANEPGRLTSQVWNSPTLTIPHPHLLERDFVLVPACEVAADWRHPTSRRSLREECSTRRYHLYPQAKS